MDAKACKRSEYRDTNTGRCRKLPTKIKDWERERHSILKSEVDFWRNQEDRGWVDIARVEPGAPAWEGGKNRYGLHMNTPRVLRSHYFTKLENARGHAVNWMKKYPDV